MGGSDAEPAPGGMSPGEARAPDAPRLERADRRSRRILERLFGPPDTWLFRVRLASGRELGNPGRPKFTLILEHPGALRAMLLPPNERSAGEAYVRGLCDVEGDLEAAIRAFREAILDDPPGGGRRLSLLWSLLALPNPDGSESDVASRPRERPDLPGPRHSPDRDAIAVRHHYDVSNEFYDLWLDPWMQYSCAYFPTGRESLEVAQRAKLDLVCQKLGLSPGHELLDVGCGWGGLIRYAAREYGVHATGITLSEEQARRARRDLAEAGLEDRCRTEVRDYRDLPGDWIFDRAVSVGMVEHVGRTRMTEFFGAVHGHLRPGGLFLNVGIVDPGRPLGASARLARRLLRRRRSFVEEHVFPDGELVAPAERIGPAETAGFELRGAENLREHYALTLRHWIRRLEDRWEEAVRLVGEPLARTWRLYMAGSAHAFQAGRLGLLHELYAKPDETGGTELPLSRPDLPGP